MEIIVHCSADLESNKNDKIHFLFTTVVSNLDIKNVICSLNP